MTYELRVIPDCPNSTAALELFRRALAAESKQRPDVRVVELEQRGAGTVPDFRGRLRLSKLSGGRRPEASVGLWSSLSC